MQPAPDQPTNPPSRKRSLRSIPGGYDIDAWPITVVIRGGETLESWLVRSSARYAITPRELLIEAGFGDNIKSHRQFAGRVHPHAAELAGTLGCPAAEVTAAAAEALPDAAIVDYLGRYRGVTRPSRSGSAFCPRCLAAAEAYWKREWSSTFAIACEAHACLLLHTCPRCGERPWSTKSWLSQRPGAPVYRCPNRPRRPSGRMIRSRRCNFDLRKVGLFAMDADTIAAHTLAFELWQQYLHNPSGRVCLAGVEVTATIAFDALCQLVDESIGILRLFDHGYALAALARALRDAGRVLSAASTTAAAENADTVRLLDPTGPVTPVAPDYALLRRKRNPLLAAIRLNSIRPTLRPAAQLMLDCGNRHPRYPLRETDDRTWLRLPEHRPELPELDHARIPQMLWPNTGWTGAQDHTPLTAAAQAMALTKIGDIRPWAIIALDLGLPKDLALPVTRYWRKIVRAGHWPEALAALTNLKEQLRCNQPPIDYQQRRIIADDPRRLVRALHHAGANSNRLGNTEFRDVLARYWELFTGGDIRLAARPYALPADQHHHWPAKRSHIDAEYRELFGTAYMLMATGYGLKPIGPLVWQPP